MDDDGDGVTEDECDCDDTAPFVYFGNTAYADIPNGIDEDCDGQEGEDGTGTGTGTGVGTGTGTGTGTGVGTGTGTGLVFPDPDGETTACTSYGVIACYGACDVDDDGDGLSEEQCDCMDAFELAYPGSDLPDIPNGIDEDCDGEEGEDTLPSP